MNADLLVDNDIDLDTCLGATLQDLIESPFLVLNWRATQEQLWGKPPIGDIDGLGCLFQRLRDRPEVVQRIDVPLDAITLANWREGLEPMRVGNLRALTICFLLVFLVVTMIVVDDIVEFADLVFQVGGLCLCIVEMRLCEFVSAGGVSSKRGGGRTSERVLQMIDFMLDLVLKSVLELVHGCGEAS